MFKFLEDEVWYGGVVSEGVKFPLTATDSWSIDMSLNTTVNQITTALISNCGRVIGSKKGFQVSVNMGEITISSQKAQVKILESNDKTLRGAYHLAKETFFSFDNQLIPKAMYQNAQFNTWIQLLYDQNQTEIIQYAQDIIRNGYSPGVLMIDDGWSPYYGYWDFDRKKIPDPKKMIEELHALGFVVMLWVCPHITPDTVEFRDLAKKGYLVKDKTNKVAIREWWNGYSALLDMSHPDAWQWLKDEFDHLVERYGVDGFKFDAGDARFYKDSDITFQSSDANRQSHLWAKFGNQYEYNEMRVSVNNGGKRLVQRLADKDHSWGDNGIRGLIPNQMIQSLFGYPYGCPDMIGGGEYENFLSNYNNLDQELFVRHAQISCLMPMMQFSAAPWRFLDEEYQKECLDAAKIHEEFYLEINQAFQEAAQNGEPITKPLEFVFPDQGLWRVKQQFMLGEKILVAPVYEKETKNHEVILPKGRWQKIGGNIYEGGRSITVTGGLNNIPIFRFLTR